MLNIVPFCCKINIYKTKNANRCVTQHQLDHQDTLTLRRHRMQHVNMAFVMACGWLKYCPMKNYFFLFFALLFSTIKAKKLCQDLISVPYDFEAYEEASRALYRCLLKHRYNFIFSLKTFFFLLIFFFFFFLAQQLKRKVVMKLFVELLPMIKLYTLWIEIFKKDTINFFEKINKQVKDIATSLREEVFNATGCTASVGVGSNIMRAKIGDNFYFISCNVCFLLFFFCQLVILPNLLVLAKQAKALLL